MTTYPYRLLRAIGIELEYMVVDGDTLDVRPVADRLLQSADGAYESEVEYGDIAWSNELALHVIELKTNGPVANLSGLAEKFNGNIRRMNTLLKAHDARLMPTAMHPWMDPYREMRLWPHEYNPVYHAFDRIFDCRGHGWANLQSTHINLAFGDAEEFGRLHAAIRLLLPILPALAASSPIKDGKVSGLLDTRVEVYRHNGDRILSASGGVIPEQVFTPDEYQKTILQRIYDDFAPYDPEGILRHEWANARGCIARFDRGAIEIRLLDIQECVSADLALAALVIGVVRLLCDEKLSSQAEQRAVARDTLIAVLDRTVRDADGAVVDASDYLHALGIDAHAPIRAVELWKILAGRLPSDAVPSELQAPLAGLLERGSLARRIAKAAGKSPNRARLFAIYARLADCLAGDELFV